MDLSVVLADLVHWPCATTRAARFKHVRCKAGWEALYLSYAWHQFK